MGKKLKKIFLQHKFLFLALFLFWTGTVTFLDTGQHVSFNLEPYPDGFFYVVPAWNFVLHGEFSMVFADTVIASLVTPLYSLALIPVFLLFPTPVAFYFLNVLLLSGTIFFIWLFLRENTPKYTFLAMLFAFLPVTWWLPSVPMAENMLLFLVATTLWLWKTKKIRGKKKYILLALLQTLLFLTKRSAYSFILPFSAVVAWESLLEKKWKNLVWYLTAGIVFFFMQTTLTSPEFIQQTIAPRAEQQSSSGQVWFSGSFFLQNSWEYLKMTLGFKQFFLWQKISLLPLGILGLPIISGLLTHKKRAFWSKTFPFWLLILGIVGSQSFFYFPDARYIVTALPVGILLLAVSVNHVKKSQQKLLLMGGVLLGVMLLAHRGFYKSLIGSNWFQRSRAWQYEAVKSFEKYEFETDSKLITTLPPYLFSLYSAEYPQLYPLSSDQEFTNRSQRVWGKELNYKNLLETYAQKLEAGEVLYLSNAYTTYSPEARDTFEQYQEKFTLELVFEGCEKTCNLYKLSL